MKRYKYVHIIHNDKFIVPFMEFVAEHFDANEHLYIFAFDDNMVKFPIPEGTNVKDITNRYPGKKNLLKFSAAVTPHIIRAEKVILHGLFSSDLVNYLYTHRWFLKKCYWVMWGGDYAFPERQPCRKKYVLKNMGFVVNGLTRDYENAKAWYGFKGTHIQCFFYTTNLYKEYDIQPKVHEGINILMGNSADRSNDHLGLFEKLLPFAGESIRIYAPLSYGNAYYADEVEHVGRARFGKRFIAMRSYMPFEKYLEFLGSIDIAIFNHKRQQAFGNIILLLGLGVKVYIHKDSVLTEVMKEYDLAVFDNDDIVLERLDEETKIRNLANVRKNFNSEALRECLAKVFGG